ncbi:hypothetical protein ACFL56_01435 [Candidatus Margulisiibacteriota bacterium]
MKKTFLIFLLFIVCFSYSYTGITLGTGIGMGQARNDIDFSKYGLSRDEPTLYYPVIIVGYHHGLNKTHGIRSAITYYFEGLLIDLDYVMQFDKFYLGFGPNYNIYFGNSLKEAWEKDSAADAGFDTVETGPASGYQLYSGYRFSNNQSIEFGYKEVNIDVHVELAGYPDSDGLRHMGTTYVLYRIYF